jgi:hypothetical protein
MKKKIVVLIGCLVLGLVSGVLAQNVGEFFDPSTGQVPLNFLGRPVFENPTITLSDFDPMGVVWEAPKPVPSFADSHKMNTLFDPMSGGPIVNPFTGQVVIK